MEGRKFRWRTSLTKTEPGKIVVRGYRIEDLLGRTSFTEMIHLLLTGDRPTQETKAMLDAALVSFVDFGIMAPSVRVARISSSVGVPLMQSAAAGLIAFSGDYHGGAVGNAAAMLSSGLRQAEQAHTELRGVAMEIVNEYERRGDRIPGFGHPLNKEFDPRTRRLFQLAEENRCSGDHIKLCKFIREAIRAKKQIWLSINPDAAVAAVLLDLGYDVKLVPAFPAMARIVGLLGHAYEEKTRERVFRIESLDEILYDGPEERKE